MPNAVTSAEAAQLLCPRGVAPTCRGAGCMGWRWIDGTHQYVRTQIGRKPIGEGWVPGSKVEDYQLWRREKEPSSRRGYCGAVTGELRVFVEGDPYAAIVVEGEVLRTEDPYPE